MCGLMKSLSRQRASRDSFRVVIVDDRSSDGTAASASSMSGDLDPTIIRVDEVPENTAPKKYALHTGIIAASGDVILLTDADCRPQAGWIESMLREFSDGAQIVLGISPERGSGAAGSYSAYESARTAALYIAAARFRQPYMSVGRNWGFRKSRSDAAGGLPPIYGILGGDDDLLLQRMLRLRPAVSVLTAPDTHCPTRSPSNFGDIARRKLRHYSVSMHYPIPAMLALGLLTFTEICSFFIAPVYFGAFRGINPLVCVAAALLKAFYDTGLLVPAFSESGLRTDGIAARSRIALLELFHLVFSTVTGLLSFVLKPRW